MRLSMLVPYASNDFRAAADLVVELEGVGLDQVWIAEPYGFDAPTQLGYLASVTSAITLAAGILPVYSRTPALIAMTAAGLDMVSGGRALLGLGASGPQVIEGWHGVPYTKPVARTREVIEICRRVWRREKLEYEGSVFSIPYRGPDSLGLGKPLRLISHPVRDSIPIFVAAMGDANVRVTAEVADGWMPEVFAPTRAHDVWGEALAAGRVKRDPTLGPLQICAGGAVAIGSDVDHLLDELRPQVALYLGGMGARGANFYNNVFARYGYEKEAKLIQDLYLDGKKAEAAAAIPVAYLREISLIGDAGYVRERLAAYDDAGVTTLNVQPLGSDPVQTVQALKALLP